ncbi:MAG: HlyD family efflux transporter periplasmic adaptor subunit [Gemmatimonadetes bacterium]|nr:HlyD family efflux transporter periplasmic adaptor subunit [Gemmatimonadota bacterium]NNF13132.1 HlyD family efflux transporter periplasmic adaptor subunit [Gemmatimonadota bacterium]NNL31040.1 HlyD family efflux transporter periplasmic adaptor subunit [Gemmatimonadota bacterium]
MNSRLKIVVPLALLSGVVLWWVLRPGTGDPASLEASGTVEATTADLGFQLPGRIQELPAAEGDAVVAGQRLARLDTRELEAGLLAARAREAAAAARLAELLAGARPQEIATAEAAQRSASQQAATARRELERARTLFEGGAISRQDLGRAETAVDVAEAAHEQASEALALVREGPRSETIRAQRAAVDQASASAAQVEAQLDNAVVSAPFAGVVTVRHREPGETVAPGAPVVTVLNRDDRWVRIYVREDLIGRVQIGMSASIRSDSYPDREYEGEVVFIGSEAEFTPRNVQTEEERTKLVYPVKVRITGDDGYELKPGIPADVRLLEEPRTSE